MAINNTLSNIPSGLLKTSINKNPSLSTTPAQSALQNKMTVNGALGGVPSGILKTSINNSITPPQISSQAIPTTPQHDPVQQSTSGLVKPVAQPTSSTTLPLYNPNASLQGITNSDPSMTISGQNTSTSTPGLIAPPNYSDIVGSLVQRSSQPSQDYTDALARAQKINQDIAQSKTNLANNLAGNANDPVDLTFQQGRARVMTDQSLAQQNALSSELQGETNLLGAANTQQSLQQSGLNSAAGLAQLQLAGFDQQAFNPLTGQFGSGRAGTSALSQLPPQAQSAIQSYAQQVQNGSMTRQDAESRLSAYGVAGTNALNEVLGSGFNTNASNASAGTTATGQQIQTAAKATNEALDTLSNLFSNLTPFQTGTIPALNNVANWIAQNLGSQALSAYKTNLSDARSQLIGVLNSSGGTPTGNEATALQYLPDNMTKAQFDANVGTPEKPGIVRQLVSQKVNSFTQSGQQNNATTNNSSLYSF